MRALVDRSAAITQGGEAVTRVDRVVAMMALRRKDASVGRAHNLSATADTTGQRGRNR